MSAENVELARPIMEGGGRRISPSSNQGDGEGATGLCDKDFVMDYVISDALKGFSPCTF